MTIEPKRRYPESRFVVDGFLRARAAVEPEIRAQVVAEHAEQLEAAGFWDRLMLRGEIEREVRARMDKIAPPNALY